MDFSLIQFGMCLVSSFFISHLFSYVGETLGVASHDARRHNLTANSLYSASYIHPISCSAGSLSLGCRGCFIDVSFVTGLYNSAF